MTLLNRIWAVFQTSICSGSVVSTSSIVGSSMAATRSLIERYSLPTAVLPSRSSMIRMTFHGWVTS